MKLCTSTMVEISGLRKLVINCNVVWTKSYTRDEWYKDNDTHYCRPVTTKDIKKDIEWFLQHPHRYRVWFNMDTCNVKIL